VANENYRPAGTSADGVWQTLIEPEHAGWRYSGIRVLPLAAGAQHTFDTGESEFVFVPLEGSFDVVVEGQTHTLAGRINVFSGPADTLYVPRDCVVTVRSAQGGRIALPNARARSRRAVQYTAARDIPTSVRGGGTMSRRIFDFGGVDAIDADRLIACEVITPGGNWSSYPAHKHDEDSETESELEEIYYYEVADGPNGPGSAFQRVTASTSGGADLLEEVRSGDTVLIPNGWHGPAMAAPGFDLYYLNVMAGPADERRWLITDDPTTAWLRETWPGLPVDERLLLDESAPR
jgi:5-deoxy-glucuronate isomerase